MLYVLADEQLSVFQTSEMPAISFQCRGINPTSLLLQELVMLRPKNTFSHLTWTTFFLSSLQLAEAFAVMAREGRRLVFRDHLNI